MPPPASYGFRKIAWSKSAAIRIWSSSALHTAASTIICEIHYLEDQLHGAKSMSSYQPGILAGRSLFEVCFRTQFVRWDKIQPRTLRLRAFPPKLPPDLTITFSVYSMALGFRGSMFEDIDSGGFSCGLRGMGTPQARRDASRQPYSQLWGLGAGGTLPRGNYPIAMAACPRPPSAMPVCGDCCRIRAATCSEALCPFLRLRAGRNIDRNLWRVLHPRAVLAGSGCTGDSYVFGRRG